jgi:hypothetical protein
VWRFTSLAAVAVVATGLLPWDETTGVTRLLLPPPITRRSNHPASAQCMIDSPIPATDQQQPEPFRGVHDRL